jgi:hypothetical protein
MRPDLMADVVNGVKEETRIAPAAISKKGLIFVHRSKTQEPSATKQEADN